MSAPGYLDQGVGGWRSDLPDSCLVPNSNCVMSVPARTVSGRAIIREWGVDNSKHRCGSFWAVRAAGKKR